MRSTANNGGYRDRRSMKHVLDNVHGYIYLDPLFLQFIDTEQFQRLRDLKQLGLTHMVYPGAAHSRFEHSLGVYWLAGEAVNKINFYQGQELGIEEFDRNTVKLAGLLHDIGHGPFSHMFEREFLPRVLDGYEWSHEDMSLKMIEYIVDKHCIDIDSAILKTAKEMILASSEHGPEKSMTEKRFLYDIVANGRTEIDVDKFDYIVRDSRACGIGSGFQFERLMETMRVMDDEIYLTLHKLFATRADLHRTVYTHPKVKAIELMVVDALCYANADLGIAASIQKPSEFWKKSGGVTLKEEDVAVSTVKIDLTHGRMNPLERQVGFYQDYDSSEKFRIPDDRISHLLPRFFQDRIVRVYAKKPELVEAVAEAFENYQVKTYGCKAQVHATPDKKKARKQLEYQYQTDRQ
ncbi:PREDICTED: deoxynucleoside triphosphate [Prunus dulcis]|uniref:PREDICTED: deoxynucleoside triphosphate n=1 Tax=Prunus dulcis TaxID=3755 RepID=A0A5E4EHW8_PRUDU|nr:PREDICTED: deoxynucleoside triphosphate [Prunus dulcis]